MIYIKKVFPYVLVILLSLLTILPLLHAGFFAMHDDTQVSRIYLMAKALADGQFPVRWVEDLGYGYGYPIFNFYAPFPYYVGGILTLLVKDSLLATKLVFALAMIGSGITMYFFTKKFFGFFGALCSSVLYMYFPYHAVNMYVRGNLSELYAYIFLPLFFASIYSLYYSKAKKISENLRIILLLTISLGLIVISHNLSAYMTLFLTGILVVSSLCFKKNKKVYVLSLGIGILAGFVLSAFYWIPALFEMRFTDVQSQIGGGSDFHDHFVCLSQLWNSAWGYTGSVPGCVDGMSFRIGKTNILLMLPIFIALVLHRFLKKSPSFLVYSSAVLLAFSVFLTTEYSQVLWNTVPGMEYLQFPWRFLNYTGLFFSILVGFLIWQIQQRFSKIVTLVVTVLIIGGTISIYSRVFIPEHIYERSDIFYTSRDYIAYTVTKRSDEYLPPNFSVLISEDEIPDKKIYTDGDVQIKELKNKTGYYEAEVIAGNSARLNFAIAYFPAWHVLLDDVPQQITPTQRGFYIDIPQGTYIVKAEFKQTQIQMIANILSFIGFVFFIIGIIKTKSYGTQRKTS